MPLPTQENIYVYIEELIDQRQYAEQQYQLLATEMVYEGNSVQHWHNKAEAYGNALSNAWAALRDAGIKPDGEKDVVAGIKELAARATKNGEVTER